MPANNPFQSSMVPDNPQAYNFNASKGLTTQSAEKLFIGGDWGPASWDSAPPQRRLMKQPVGRTVS